LLRTELDTHGRMNYRMYYHLDCIDRITTNDSPSDFGNTELGDLFISIFAAQLVDLWFGRGLNQDDT